MKTDAAKAAKMLKAEIQKAFPGIKVRVKSENYSMGDSVNVYITDQKPEVKKKITEMAAKYQYGHFNGMEDIYEYSNTREDIPQTKFIFVNNEKSEGMREKLQEFANQLLPRATENERSQLRHRIFCGSYETNFWENV